VDKIIKPARIKHKEITAETSSIFLKVDRRLIKVDFSKILYIQGMGDYLKVHAIKKTYITYMTMGKIESLLPISKFAEYTAQQS